MILADAAEAAKRELAPRSSDIFHVAAAGVICALIVSALYYGRALLEPLALAILLAFALAPIVEFLRRLQIPRSVSVAVTVLFAVFSIAGIATFVAMQIGALIVELPHFQENLTHKIESIRGSTSSNPIVISASGLMNKFNAALAGKSFQAASRTPAAGQALGTGVRPLPVAIKQPEAAPFQNVEEVLDSVLGPLGTVAIVAIFVIFILLRKEDLRDRFISLVGARDLHRTALAIDDGAERLSRYLLLQSAVNLAFGVVIGTGLWAIGVPNPVLWGLIAAIFRFVPYVGVPAAAVLPVALALAIDPGWQTAALTAGLFFGLEPIIGQAIEPALYGRHMGISSIAVVVSAGIWTWLWGPIGLLLSTPLTMCVVVLGRHVESLRFLELLLGDQPALSNTETFYLRMLSGNSDEAADQAEQTLNDHGVAEYIDTVALPGLAMAQSDANRSALKPEKYETILNTVLELVENLALRNVIKNSDGEFTSATQIQNEKSSVRQPTVLCVSSRSPLDEAAGQLLMHLLNEQGIVSAALTAKQVSKSQGQFAPDAVRVVCLSVLDSQRFTSVRFLVRRLRSNYPAAKIVAGLWAHPRRDDSVMNAFAISECDVLATSSREAMEKIGLILAAYGD